MEAHHHLCRAFSRLIFGLKCFKKEETKPSIGANEPHFYHRFAPFHKLDQPAPLFTITT